ncbi:unnamed protein product [Brachionus calyciflorus]|uniref:Uncharacterized protein n=1 Tax=Brachionus calyciflorus TaxID=104777 RepID=A0A814B0A7_9BILA|nr:unnamed protein product [Brachionus calyciflorus]
MSCLKIETSHGNLNDFKNNLNYNFTTTSINRGFDTNYDNELSIEKKFNQFKKLYQSLEDIENNLGDLSKNKQKSKFEETRKSNQASTKSRIKIRSESCDYLKEKNEFLCSSSSTKSVKFKDLECLTSENLEKESLVEEINHLKSKINNLRETNSNIKSNKNVLRAQIDDLQNNISKSLMSSGTITNSFERIDSQFFEINKILTDLNESKALLEKTRVYRNEKFESDSATLNSRPEEKSIQNPVLFTVERENEKKKFDNFLTKVDNFGEENSGLENKFKDFEFESQKKRSIKRISNHVSVDNSETESLKLSILRLNEENLKLNAELNRMRDFNSMEIARIRNEFNNLRNSHTTEIRVKSKTNRSLQSEINGLRLKLKDEECRNEELKLKYLNELNSARLRFENELSTQNNLMQTKYQDLVKEIENLNSIIKQLQSENLDLVAQLKREKNKNKSHESQKSTIVSTSKLNKKIDKHSKMTNSLSNFTETLKDFSEYNYVEKIKTKNESFYLSTVIYDTSSHSRNQPVKYVSSYHITPTSKVVEAPIK